MECDAKAHDARSRYPEQHKSLLAAYVRILRPWHLKWGTAEDRARPSAIWPWLVQIGPGRGGAYTYDWIVRRLGIDIHNVARIIPELQNLDYGDEIEMPGY